MLHAASLRDRYLIGRLVVTQRGERRERRKGRRAQEHKEGAVDAAGAAQRRSSGGVTSLSSARSTSV